MTDRKYIPEIDGLRAFAVLAVVGFHYFPAQVPGGFIGVDIFFVISGFVISRAFLSGLVTNETRLRDFYLRRVRRLAPAYAVVLFFTTIGAFVFLGPNLLMNYGESLFGQGVYLQNVVFWVQGEYFDRAETKPLLHTWSLAIEEQFYLLFGVLVILARWRRSLLVPLLAISSIAAIAAGIFVAGVSPKTSFYLLPFRVWEFALGIAAYAASTKLAAKRGGPWVAVAFVLGLATLVISSVAFDGGSRFPGPQSYLACAATLFVIVLVESRPHPSYRLLRTRPARKLGELSYSLYLWHWPFVSLYTVATGQHPSAWLCAVGILLSIALAGLTFRWVEDPIRRARRLPGQRPIVILMASFSVSCVAIAAGIIWSKGALFRYPDAQRVLYEAAQDRSPRRCGVPYRILHPGRETCPRNAVTSARAPAILVLGDSHADQLDEMIGQIGAQLGAPVFFTARSCRMDEYGHDDICSAAVRDRIIEEAKQAHVDTVVSSSMWTSGLQYAWFEENVRVLVQSGMRVIISEVVPQSRSFDPARAADMLVASSSRTPERVTRQEYEKRVAKQRAIFDRLQAEFGRAVTIVRPSERLCDERECYFATDGRPNYSDPTHLTSTGVSVVRPLYERALGLLPASGPVGPEENPRR